MKIEKLPSGSYRIRKTYKGQVYTVIFDCKPTQKEAVVAMAKELEKVQQKHEVMTFKLAYERYIESKRNVLSPSTIMGYNTIIRQTTEKFLDKRVSDITALDVQEEINLVAKKCGPKTVRNHHSLISAVLGVFSQNLKLTTTLPQKLKKEPYIPSDEDVRRILEHAKDTEYEIPILLACYGLRRSEICALQLEDIDGDIVHINKAMVPNENREWVIKSTKTTASTREVVIPMETADKIRARGYIYKGYPNCITNYLKRTERSLGMPQFSIHKLRHYFASKMSAMNVPEADIIRMGGWETDHVMKRIYRHSMEDKDKARQREISERFKDALLP
jgi:integrase|nr:site-specific integrase [uncultured Acetatifactor sp.]